MPSLNVFNNDVAQASLAPPAKVPERYAELLWYSGSYVSANNMNTMNANGGSCLKGGAIGSYTSSAAKLYTLNASWPASTKFAFEVALYTQNATATAYATLYDITGAAQVASSQVSTSATTMTVLRSSQFTLTPGHVYGIVIWSSSTSYNTYLTDASLIIFS